MKYYFVLSNPISSSLASSPLISIASSQFITIIGKLSDFFAVRIYPAINLSNAAYDPTDTEKGLITWYDDVMQNANDSELWETPFITGPYIDTKGTNQKVFAVSMPLFNDSELIGVICAEVLVSVIENSMSNLSFLSSGSIAIINTMGTLLITPSSWGFSNELLVYWQQSQQVIDATGQITPTTLNQIQNSTYKPFEITRNASISSDIQVQEYVSPIFIPNNTNWIFCLLFYVEQSELNTPQNSLLSSMKFYIFMAIVLMCCTCILTIIIIALICYSIATTLCEPLIKLIEFCLIINKNSSAKTLAGSYFKKYEKTKNEISELIEAYKNLLDIDKIGKRSKQQKNKMEFPLNQYNPQFSINAKGYTPINWKSSFDKLKNETTQFEDSVIDTTSFAIKTQSSRLTTENNEEYYQ